MSDAEFRVTMRVRNARLIGLRESLGLTQKAAAHAAGVSMGLLNGLETLRASPLSARGGWKDSSRALADFHGVDLDWLFPSEVRAFEGAPVRSLDVDAEALMLMSNGGAPPVLPDEAYASAERDVAVRDAVDSLSEPYRTVVRLRHGLGGGETMTLEQVGEVIGKSKERVRQIEARALRRLTGFAGASMYMRRVESSLPPAYREIARDESSRPSGWRNGRYGRL